MTSWSWTPATGSHAPLKMSPDSERRNLWSTVHLRNVQGISRTVMNGRLNGQLNNLMHVISAQAWNSVHHDWMAHLSMAKWMLPSSTYETRNTSAISMDVNADNFWISYHICAFDWLNAENFLMLIQSPSRQRCFLFSMVILPACPMKSSETEGFAGHNGHLCAIW